MISWRYIRRFCYVAHRPGGGCNHPSPPGRERTARGAEEARTCAWASPPPRPVVRGATSLSSSPTATPPGPIGRRALGWWLPSSGTGHRTERAPMGNHGARLRAMTRSPDHEALRPAQFEVPAPLAEHANRLLLSTGLHAEVVHEPPGRRLDGLLPAGRRIALGKAETEHQRGDVAVAHHIARGSTSRRSRGGG